MIPILCSYRLIFASTTTLTGLNRNQESEIHGHACNQARECPPFPVEKTGHVCGGWWEVGRTLGNSHRPGYLRRHFYAKPFGGVLNELTECHPDGLKDRQYILVPGLVMSQKVTGWPEARLMRTVSYLIDNNQPRHRLHTRNSCVMHRILLVIKSILYDVTPPPPCPAIFRPHVALTAHIPSNVKLHDSRFPP